jgi:hypothetical protein
MARVGLISDIDDTILQSSITDWKIAAQLTFLAMRARANRCSASRSCMPHCRRHQSAVLRVELALEPVRPARRLHGTQCHPHRPIFLRDIGMDTGKFIRDAGARDTSLNAHAPLIARNPHCAGSCSAIPDKQDAELYAGSRTGSSATASPRSTSATSIPGVDRRPRHGRGCVDRKVVGTRCPMLRATDSVAIAEHAASIGCLIPRDSRDRGGGAQGCGAADVERGCRWRSEVRRRPPP